MLLLLLLLLLLVVVVVVVVASLLLLVVVVVGLLTHFPLFPPSPPLPHHYKCMLCTRVWVA